MSGRAARQEQKRTLNEELEEKNKQFPVFMFGGYGFRPEYQGVFFTLNLVGPLCPRPITKDRTCLAELKAENAETTTATCEVCGGTFILPYGTQRFREIAHTAYQGYLNFVESGGHIQTLDTPFNAIKERSVNDNRAIEIKWSQKDGRNQAEILFIERDTDRDKTQVFADFDREELRHDASNTAPKQVLAKIEATFKGVQVEIDYEPERKEE